MQSSFYLQCPLPAYDLPHTYLRVCVHVFQRHKDRGGWFPPRQEELTAPPTPQLQISSIQQIVQPSLCDSTVLTAVGHTSPPFQKVSFLSLFLKKFGI